MRADLEMSLERREELEAEIVAALNTAWPESIGDHQTWDDKQEAVENAIEAAYPESEPIEVEAAVDSFMEDYVVRVEPYDTAKRWQIKSAAEDLQAAAGCALALLEFEAEHRKIPNFGMTARMMLDAAIRKSKGL